MARQREGEGVGARDAGEGALSLNRFRARKDANHREITAGLRAAGIAFWDVEWPCDLLAAHKADRRLVALEIKRDNRSRMTEAQQELRIFLAPNAFYRVETVEQALEAVGAVHVSTD